MRYVNFIDNIFRVTLIYPRVLMTNKLYGSGKVRIIDGKRIINTSIFYLDKSSVWWKSMT